MIASEPATVHDETDDTTRAAASVVDELDKLDALRRRGVLTQAEFDAQKRTLLDP